MAPKKSDIVVKSKKKSKTLEKKKGCVKKVKPKVTKRLKVKVERLDPKKITSSQSTASSVQSVDVEEIVSSQATSVTSGSGSESRRKITKRGENWQHKELRCLLDFCKKHIDELEGEHNPKNTRDSRRRRWQELTLKLNS
jgi:hypothetical protein